jgi:hypothetical protein
MLIAADHREFAGRSQSSRLAALAFTAPAA